MQTLQPNAAAQIGKLGSERVEIFAIDSTPVFSVLQKRNVNLKCYDDPNINVLQDKQGIFKHLNPQGTVNSVYS